MPLTIFNNLRPSPIAVIDYGIAQTPALGGEREVYLSSIPALFLGKADMTADGVVNYRVENAPIIGAAQVGVTVANSADGVVVTGTGSTWLTTLKIGDRVIIDDVADIEVTVKSIESDTSFTAAAPIVASHTAVPLVVATRPIVAFVMTGLRADAAAVVTLGGLTDSFAPAAYARNQTFDFPATRGIELVGTLGTIVRATLPTITKAKTGSKIGFVQLPHYSEFYLVGCTTGKDIDAPIRTSKSISCGLETTRFNKPGKTTEGKLSVKARDMGEEDGLNRFKGLNTTAMVETQKEERVTTARQFFTNFVPGGKITNPDADGESEVNGEGMFQHMITLVAPGS